MRWVFGTIFLLLFVPAVDAADITVCDGGGCAYTNSQLQTALDAAACGDTIKLQDGALYRPALGGYKLKSKNPCTSYTTLTRTGTLPSIYDVIPNCYQLGPNFVAEMAKKASCFAALKLHYETNAPKIYVTHADQNLGFGQPITIGFDADYWKIQGVHIYTEGTGTVDSGNPSYGLVNIGFHEVTGANMTNASEVPHHIIIDRVSMHGTVEGATNRCVYANANYFELTNSLCYNIHMNGYDAQAVISVSGNGPFLIENNFSEVAGEDYLFGGADPTVPLALPSDIVQTRNYMTSDWTWWPDCSRLLAAYGYDCTYGGRYWQLKNKTECKNCQRNYIYGNVIEGSWQVDQMGNLMLFQSIPNGPDCDHCVVKDIYVYNNVVRYGGQGIAVAGYGGGGSSVQLMGSGILVENNLFYGIRGMFTSLYNAGECFAAVSGSAQDPLTTSYDDVTFNHNTCDNDAGTMMLMNTTGDIYTNFTFTNNIGRAKSNFSAIAMACACNGGTAGFDIMAPGSYTVSNNAISTHGTEWPWPANNWFEAVTGDETATFTLYKAIFTDYDTSDYTVAAGSLYKAGGARDSTTGTDLGVDMSLLPEGDQVEGGESPTPLPVFRLRFRR